MEDIEKVKAYALKNYPKMFTKKIKVRNGRGQLEKVVTEELPVIVEDNGVFFTVRNHKDASPLILSKTILG